MGVPGRNAAAVIMRDARRGRVTNRLADTVERVRDVVFPD
jgi:hypothetical protein